MCALPQKETWKGCTSLAARTRKANPAGTEQRTVQGWGGGFEGGLCKRYAAARGSGEKAPAGGTLTRHTHVHTYVEREKGLKKIGFIILALVQVHPAMDVCICFAHKILALVLVNKKPQVCRRHKWRVSNAPPLVEDRVAASQLGHK